MKDERQIEVVIPLPTIRAEFLAVLTVLMCIAVGAGITWLALSMSGFCEL